MVQSHVTTLSAVGYRTISNEPMHPSHVSPLQKEEELRKLTEFKARRERELEARRQQLEEERAKAEAELRERERVSR